MKKLSLLGLILLSGTTYANVCPPSSETIFECATTNNKHIEVCDNKKTIGYKFGKVDQKPELSFSVPRQRASTYQWNGMGSNENYSVTVPNGKTLYTVFSSFDKNSMTAKSGVRVEQNGKTLATVYCDEDIEIRDHLMDVNLPKSK